MSATGNGDRGGASDGPTLYLESSALDPTEAFCTEVLDGDETDEYRVVQLTSAQSFDSLHDTLDGKLEEINDPAEAAVIILSPQSDDDSAVTEVGDGVPLYGFWVDPMDLTGISVAFSRLIEEWEDTSGSVKICLRNIESLLPYHDADLVYRFLNTVLATLQGAGADVHAHIRPSALDDRPLELFSSLFANVVESTADESTADDTETDTGTEALADSSSTATDTAAAADASQSAASRSSDSTTAMMADDEIDSLLESTGYGVLALDGSPPYAIPMSYGYDPEQRVCYMQLSDYEGSEKQARVAESDAASLVVLRYSRPDQWYSIVVDGTLSRLSGDEVRERDVLDIFASSDIASVDVFTQDLSEMSFDWFALEPSDITGLRSDQEIE